MKMQVTIRGGGLAPFGDAGLVLPGRYTAEIEFDADEAATLKVGGVRLDVVVENGQPVCEAVTVRRHSDPEMGPVTAERLRGIALVRLLRASAAAAAMRDAQRNPDGSWTFEPAGPADAGRLIDADRRAAGRGRRREVTPAHLKEVAAVYRAAGPNAPTSAVAKKWKVARPTASRWVARARDAGLLGPYTRGEHDA